MSIGVSPEMKQGGKYRVKVKINYHLGKASPAQD